MTIGGLRLGKGLAWGLPIAALVAVLDQLSKWKILCLMRPEGVMETPFIGKGVIQALPFLDLVMAWNRGVSFGMGNNSGGWNVVVFTAVAAVVGGMLVAWMARTSTPFLKKLQTMLGMLFSWHSENAAVSITRRRLLIAC